jgi:hypothetical protein
MNDAAFTRYKSPLHKMTQATPTCPCNDSASGQELKYSIEDGPGGATCNPVIVFGALKKVVLGALKKELPTWSERFDAIAIEVRFRIDEPVPGESS